MSTRLNLFAVISFLFLTVACSEDNTTVEPEQTTYSLTLITERGGLSGRGSRTRNGNTQ